MKIDREALAAIVGEIREPGSYPNATDYNIANAVIAYVKSLSAQATDAKPRMMRQGNFSEHAERPDCYDNGCEPVKEPR